MKIDPLTLGLVGGLNDHLFTDHGLEECDASMKRDSLRKSKWYGNEAHVTQMVENAFDQFRQEQIRSVDGNGEVTLTQNQYLRTVKDVDTGVQTGTVNGVVTQGVRLVMRIKNSGETEIITAFPI
ncbi:hypothetical protein GIW70_13125 [Pseudomonas syringae]|nr:hypothetical protein [Pseudomonas syringae]MCF5069128.1 hypothetical protein [Pseudomonas syringae]